MSQDPVDDLLVLDTGNDSDSTPATIAHTISIFLTSQRVWHSPGILRQRITRGMVDADCCLLHTLEERWPQRQNLSGTKRYRHTKKKRERSPDHTLNRA